MSPPKQPTRSALVAGSDYPRTYREFVEMSPDDLACSRYLEALRWPDGFKCPKCGVEAEPWRQTRGRLKCSSCRCHTTPTSGTILDKTRAPLTTWFEAAWHVTTAKNGLSAKTLERTLGVRYRVAWAMLQRFRVAMVRSERERLTGAVEIDEALIGGVERGGVRGRGTAKEVVAIAVEVLDPKGFGRLRMRHIADASGANLARFVHDVVAVGSEVHTDGWGGYNDLAKFGYTHRKTVLSSSPDPAHVAMPCLSPLHQRVSRAAIARAFVTKMVYDLSTTRMLLDWLESDPTIRRICGWEWKKEVPSEATFSRAFAELAESRLPERIHQVLIEQHLGDQLIGHISRDSTA
ncbi:MAG: IS1595 family transposase, partial [Gammaproteobacteria bacterium]|nr:IS1595 family transposase [Gammaproteobacteria bacterium]MBU1654137.1 IS1595 family transposase [Gammaproteobacteria bacterium]MBU1960331.1 IS1595 family transposase [Gammaproteobacteria bacterium]